MEIANIRQQISCEVILAFDVYSCTVVTIKFKAIDAIHCGNVLTNNIHTREVTGFRSYLYIASK